MAIFLFIFLILPLFVGGTILRISSFVSINSTHLQSFLEYK